MFASGCTLEQARVGFESLRAMSGDVSLLLPHAQSPACASVQYTRAYTTKRSYAVERSLPYATLQAEQDREDA